MSARAYAAIVWALFLSAYALHWLPFVLIPLRPTPSELEAERARARGRRRARILS